MEKNALFTAIYQYVDAHELIPDSSTIVVGFSGGPDSLFLLHVLHTLRSKKNIQLIAAHLDHEWRPESAQDVLFCERTAAKLDIPYVKAKLSELTTSIPWNGSKEEVGRRARRFFLESVAREHGATAIALAHHANDQQETFFIRLLRGATLTGLTGMKPKQGLYIRPLLPICKADIVAYLDELGMTYLTDPSNSSDIYLRNRIRSTVIPALRTCDDRFDKNFLSTITRLQETEDFLDTMAHELLMVISKPHTTQESSFSANQTSTYLDMQALLDFPIIMQYRVVLAWLCNHRLPFEPTQAFLDEILRFLHSPQGGIHTLHPSWQLVKHKRHAYLKKI
jgi:tRNA(Ile)-lysidine synthase